MAYGSEEQKKRFFPRNITAEDLGVRVFQSREQDLIWQTFKPEL
jgi:hypothetical protein